MKRLGVFLLPPGWDASPSQGIKFAGTYLHSWVERSTVRVKCLTQEHNTVSPATARPGQLAPESSGLTMRPSRLPRCRVENQQTQSTNDAESGNRTWTTLVKVECSHHCAIPALQLKREITEQTHCNMESIC